MDSVRTEGSLIASLRELRAIEQQRLADERAAIEAAIQAKREERARAERLAQEAEAARIAAERDAQMAAEHARAEAERRARLALEAAEAAERARHMVALEARRHDEEMALRREVAMRQRPRWMMALTGGAVIAAIGLGCFALERLHASRLAEEAERHAIAARIDAEDTARRAREELEVLARKLHDLDGKITAGIQAVQIAQNEAERRAAQDRLRQLQRQEADLREQQRRREEERRHQERINGVHMSADCLHNAVCK